MHPTDNQGNEPVVEAPEDVIHVGRRALSLATDHVRAFGSYRATLDTQHYAIVELRDALATNLEAHLRVRREASDLRAALEATTSELQALRAAHADAPKPSVLPKLDQVGVAGRALTAADVLRAEVRLKNVPGAQPTTGGCSITCGNCGHLTAELTFPSPMYGPATLPGPVY